MIDASCSIRKKYRYNATQHQHSHVCATRWRRSRSPLSRTSAAGNAFRICARCTGSVADNVWTWQTSSTRIAAPAAPPHS